MTLHELHIYIQSYKIEAILDLANAEIRTKHFTIRERQGGGFDVLEKNVDTYFIKTRIVATELSKR